MADSWLDFEAIAADRPISSAITISGWRGNLDRAISQSGYFCSATTGASAGEVFTGTFSKIADTEIPILVRRKEDGDCRDLRVIFEARTTDAEACVVRVTADGGGTIASGQVTVESSTAFAASTTITGISTWNIVSDWSGPAGIPIDQPAIVWLYFSGQLVDALSSEVLTIENVTVIEVP